MSWYTVMLSSASSYVINSYHDFLQYCLDLVEI
jgi:hypothetical protein